VNWQQSKDHFHLRRQSWDDTLLAAELAALQQEDFNLDLIGFEDEELARLLAAP